jgi:NTE family protein
MRSPWVSNDARRGVAQPRLACGAWFGDHARMTAMRMGLVMSGGGARGAFQVGVWERLRGDPRFAGPLVLSGTSAGAINAAMIAAGKSPDEMMAFWEGLADSLPIAPAPGLFESVVAAMANVTIEQSLHWVQTAESWATFGRRLIERFPPTPARVFGALLEVVLTERFDLVTDFIETIRTPSLVDTKQLRARLVGVLGERLQTGDHDLAISAVDAESGQIVRFVSRHTPSMVAHATEYIAPPEGLGIDMVLASASIPVLFPPAEIDGRKFWDGGLLVNTPLAPVVALGADCVTTVLVTELAAHGPALDRLGIALERTVDTLLENSYLADRKLLLERNRLAALGVEGYRRTALYKPIRPGAEADLDVGAFLYFKLEVLRELREAGRAAADRWLADPDPEDRL